MKKEKKQIKIINTMNKIVLLFIHFCFWMAKNCLKRFLSNLLLNSLYLHKLCHFWLWSTNIMISISESHKHSSWCSERHHVQVILKQLHIKRSVDGKANGRCCGIIITNYSPNALQSDRSLQYLKNSKLTYCCCWLEQKQGLACYASMPVSPNDTSGSIHLWLLTLRNHIDSTFFLAEWIFSTIFIL